MDATPVGASSAPDQGAMNPSGGDVCTAATIGTGQMADVAAVGVGASSALPEPDGLDDWAICCSGAGIRAASYCLGALQSLDQGGLLAKARWILGVSGGSYIAASRAVVAHFLDQADPARPPDALDPARAFFERPPYAPGSPEEQHLRRYAGHIAGDASTVLVGGLSLLGALVMVTVVLAPLYAFSHAWGWLLNWQDVLTRPGPGLKMSASVTTPSWWVVPVVAAAITTALFVSWWRTFQSGVPRRWSGRASWTGGAVAVTAALAVAMLGVPLLISSLNNTTGPFGSIVHFFALLKSQYLSRAALPGLIAVAAAVARSIKRELDKVDEPAGLKSADATPSTGRKVASWALNRLLPWLASAALIAIGVGAALLWIAAGATAGFTLSQLWPVIAALAIMLLGRIALDVNGSSLHNLFRWRLAATYAITRSAAQAWGSRAQQLFAMAARTRLSDLRNNQGEPTLVIGTTANINANREVVPGRGGFSLAFDPHRATLRGDPMAGEPHVAAQTTDYEHLLGHTRFTLCDMIAISGAPLSPRMRAMADRGAYRLLLILTNMRLGVWMPHPDVVRSARFYLDMPPEHRRKDRWWVRRTWLLLLWYQAPRPFWPRDHGEQQRAMARRDREARLWARLLELRQRSAEGDSSLPRAFARLQAALCWRAMQPTLGLLWAEAVGRTSSRATWIKVSDGDRHDNLGLVEALKRGSRNIMVLDASGDHPGTWRSVGRAISLARSAGFEINLDPATARAANGEPGRGTTPRDDDDVTRPWTRGTFTWPQYSGFGQSQHGHIVVCKLGWLKGTQWDIQASSGDYPDYPYETAFSQLYDSADVEPYQRLGASAIAAAMHDLANCDLCSPR